MNSTEQATAKPTSQPSAPVHSNLLQQKCACDGTSGVDGMCGECREKQLQRNASDEVRPDPVPPIVREVLRSPGEPLDPKARAIMEPRFGHDFSRVRVHTDNRAARSAQAVNALAYTVGRDVVFGSGQYMPATREGHRLLAHELTHVVQQGSGQDRSTSSLPQMIALDPSERLEQHADSVMAPGMINAGSDLASMPTTPSSLSVTPIQSAQKFPQYPAAVMQRQVAEASTPGATPTQIAASQEQIPWSTEEMSASMGNDSQLLIDVMRVVQSVRPSEFASGLYTTEFQGQTISLTQAQRDELYAQAKAAIKKNLKMARQRAETAKGSFEYQEKINEEEWVAPIVLAFSGVEFKGPMLLASVAKAEMAADAGEKALEANDFTEAARNLAEAEAAAVQAASLWREYHEGIIGTAESTVTTLEYTRDASFITLGVLAVIATGGAAAGAAGAAGTTTTAFGLQVGTVSAANLIATGAPIVATLGSAGVQAALGDKVDWAKVGVDVAVNVILARFGGKLSNGIFRALLGHPAVRSMGEVAFGRIFSSLVTHELSTAFTATVDAVYRKLKGEDVTWDQFLDELKIRLTDPKGLIVASIMGAVAAGADVKLGGAREINIVDERGKKLGNFDAIRGGALIEEKSAQNLAIIPPGKTQPAQTPAEWAERQIYGPTVKRINNLPGATATAPDTGQGGSRDFPSLKEIQSLRKYEFHIDADTSTLRTAVENQLQRLRADFPDWTFTAKYGK